jgi:hypothetical protein
VARRHACEQKHRREQSRNESHDQPQLSPSSEATVSIRNFPIQDIASVLPDRVFVQMAGIAQMKFKSSVASKMHLVRVAVPNWNNRRGTRCDLPLTMVCGAGFDPGGERGTRDGE